MKDFQPEYQRLNVQNIHFSGLAPMEDFHTSAVDLIDRARQTALAQLQNMDKGLRPDVFSKRANDALWKIKADTEAALSAKAAIFDELARRYQARLADALAPAATNDPVQALRWETQVNELRRQLEVMSGPQRITAAMQAAKEGRVQILAALDGSLRPLVPSDVLDQVRDLTESKAAPVARKAYEDALTMQDEAKRVLYEGPRSILSYVASSGFPGVAFALTAPVDPNAPRNWTTDTRAAFIAENGHAAYEAALRTGKIPRPAADIEAEAEVLRDAADQIVFDALPK